MTIAYAPRCSDTIMGYAIGHCAVCHRHPIILYVTPKGIWRCEKCLHPLAPVNKVIAS